MPEEFINVSTTDYSIKYYMNNLYTKANCSLLSNMNNDNKFEANEIIPGVYLGNINSVYDFKRLKDLRITHIISVLSGFTPPYPEDFNYLVINALDSVNTDIQESFSKSNEFIDDAFGNCGNVLIHCMAGRSRSATILSAFMIKTFGSTVETTLSLIKKERSIIDPNEYFKEQLRIYYDMCYPSKYL